MKKRFLLIAIVLLSVCTSYSQEFTVDSIVYNIIDTNTKKVEIIDYVGSNTDITIPTNVTYINNSYTVVSIGDHAFDNNSLTDIVIPNSVTSIGESAFKSNFLTSVVIPNSVTSIGSGAFRYNRLISFTIPNNVTSIGSIAFENNWGLIKVISLSSNPAVLLSSAGARAGMDLFIPIGTSDLYASKGWTGFKTVIEGDYNNLDTFTVNDIQYKIINEELKEVEIIGYTGSSKDINLPSTVTYNAISYKVKIIGYGAFNTVFNNKQLTSVIIPNSVTSIQRSAFAYNKLTSITIPNSVTSIGESAFTSNSLTGVNIPNSVTSIGESAFTSNSLTGVNIPNSVTSIGDHAFSYNSLTRVVIPNGVTSIEDHAFSHNNLIGVTIPNSVTSIGSNAFYGNSNLTKVVSLSSNPFVLLSSSLGLYRNKIDLFIPIGTSNLYTTKEWTGFKTVVEGDYNNLDTFIVNDIQYQIINEELKEVEIIGYTGSSKDINLLSTVTYNAISYKVKIIGYGAFFNKQLTSVIIPNSVISIGDYAFEWNSLTSVDIPDSVISIGKLAFKWNSLTSVIISNNITKIEEDTFSANELTDVIIPNGVTSIGANAFRSNVLTEAIIPNSVTSIEESAFAYNKLTTITIPESITSIENRVFSGNYLRNITIPENVTSIGAGAFSYNILTSVTIPENVTSIGSGAFSDNHLTSIICLSTDPIILNKDIVNYKSEIDLITPEGTSILYAQSGWIGFKNSTGETEFNKDDIYYNITGKNSLKILRYRGASNTVIIPNTVVYKNNSYVVTNIGYSVFYRKNLTSVILPNTITSIEDGAFDTNNLTSIIIPDGVKNIGIYAFYGNDLTSIIIPESITSIGSSAFRNNDLIAITSLSTNPFILEEDTFGNKQNITLTIPKGTASIYEERGWTGFKSVIEDESLSIATLPEDAVNINITGDELTVGNTDNMVVKQISIVSNVGSLITVSNSSSVDISNLSPGIYIAVIETNKGIATKKFVKQ